jgi:DNA-binding NarL/FixJ family response regulator
MKKTTNGNVRHRIGDEPRLRLAPLTKRQRDVCERIAAGQTNKAIASELHVSTSAVKRHLEKLFARLSVDCRTGLAIAFMMANRPVAKGPSMQRSKHKGN